MTTLSLQIPEKYDTQNIKHLLENFFQQDEENVEDVLLALTMIATQEEELEAQDISELRKKHGY